MEDTLPAQLSTIRLPSVRQTLLNAWRCLQYDECRRSMEYCCSAMEHLLSLRMISVTRALRQKLPALDPGVRVLQTELGLRVELVKTDYVYQECESLLRYALQLHDAVIQSFEGDSRDGVSIPFTLSERILLIVQNLSKRCVVSGQSIALRKILLRALLRLRFALEESLPTERLATDVHTRILGMLLHEPEHVVQAMLRECRFHCEYNFAKRHVHFHGLPDSQRYLDAFIWPERQDYIAYIAAQPGSRVLVTIHMGDFLGAFKCLAALAGPKRAAISLRREQDSAREKDYVIGNRPGHRVLRHGQYNPVSIVSALRRGDHTLAIMFDLKEEFGGTVAVTFFGHAARFVKGPAQLAIMGKAPILPFITFEKEGQGHMEMEAVIDTKLLTGESLDDATSRITQRLVNLAEKWISRTPAQWKYLSSLPNYFDHHCPSVGASAARDSRL